MVLISGTAVGVSLVAWSLRRDWVQRRREAVGIRGIRPVMVLERDEEKPAVPAETDDQVDAAGQARSLARPQRTHDRGDGEFGTSPLQKSGDKSPHSKDGEDGVEPVLQAGEEPPEGGTGCAGEVEATLFAVGVGMYELKAKAEEIPVGRAGRKTARRIVAEQLLLWPDADEPLAEEAAGEAPAARVGRGARPTGAESTSA